MGVSLMLREEAGNWRKQAVNVIMPLVVVPLVDGVLGLHPNEGVTSGANTGLPRLWCPARAAR